jgi:hypothetical protein
LDNLTNQIIDFADDFVTDTNERVHGRLDFTIESLQAVDELLGEAHDFIDDLNDKAIENISTNAGSYIFEVARRNFGGIYYWYEKLDQPILVTGQPDFEVLLLAVEKVKGRISNGDEDNIPFFFNGYIEAINRGKSKKGYCAMVV